MIFPPKFNFWISNWYFVALILKLISPLPTNEEDEYLYNSLSAMEVLVATEKVLIKEMEQYVRKDVKILNNVKRYLKEMNTVHIYKRRRESVFWSLLSPVITYRITRCVDRLKLIINIRESFVRNKTLIYPTETDLLGATKGVVRIQTSYGLDIKDLSNGVLKTNFSQTGESYFEVVTPLTSSDCYQIGSMYEEEANYSGLVTWMLEAIRKHETEKCTFCDIRVEDVIEFLMIGYCVSGDSNQSLKWCKERFIMDLSPDQSFEKIDFMEVVKYCVEICKAAQEKARQESSKKQNNEDYKFLSHYGAVTYARTLCRDDGEVLRRSVEGMKCSYKTGPHPFLKLARYKAEQLSQDPDIWMFHDVITDIEIASVMQWTKRKLAGAGVGDKNSINEYRTAKSMSILGSSKLGSKMLRRLWLFTELAPDHVEPIQAINYGVGGHYDLHFDVSLSDDRAATVFIYISDVQQGGATVFLSQRLRIYPVKKAAIFFRNLTPDGLPHRMTRHQSCPVLRGSKWVLTKWIHEDGGKCPRLQHSSSGNSNT